MSKRNVALFIDAENVPSSLAAAIVEEAERHGTLFHRRVYGNFARPALASWIDAAPRHALTVCQTIPGAAGKNGADIALVIDALDLFHTTDADIFCLATCDGDFTQLAMRMRQGGKGVIGMGMANASERFRDACDVFKVIGKPKGEPKQANSPTCRALKGDLLKKVFIDAPRLDGEWVGLHDLMKALKSHQPDFAVKAYGHSQLSKLLAFSGVELADSNKKARLKPALKVVATEPLRA